MKKCQAFNAVILAMVTILITGISGTAEDAVPIPPLQVRTFPIAECQISDWKAKPEVQNYEETKKLAAETETDGQIGKALTLWERVLDRTTCTEKQRSEARTHIKMLWPRVQQNTDPQKAKIWNVLTVVYKELKSEQKNSDETVTAYHKVFTESDLVTIGKELAGFRDMVFEWSSGILLLDFKVVFVMEPITKTGKDFPVSPHEIAQEFKKYSSEKKFDTVIAYVKFKDDKGANLPRPYTAAMYGHLGELDGAGYMMVPWGTDYPFKNEAAGEMELHEWLHQIDDVVHQYLGYPRGTTRSSDDGRGVGDNRPNGEEEYKKPKDCHTWAYFYKHLVTEHITRQIWSELTSSNMRDKKPGSVIKITKINEKQ